MPEESTTVLESQETEMTPGGLFSVKEFEDLKQGIKEASDSKIRDDVPRETEPEPAASDTPSELEETPATEPADEPSREPEPAAPKPDEPEVPETAEPAKEQADEESPVAVFDDQLLARADQMGFSKKAAQSFGTPDNLERALITLDQRLIGLNKPKQPAATLPAQEPAKEPTPVAPAPVAPAPVAQTIDALTIDLDPDEHSPEIVAQFKKLHNHYEARAQQFEQAFVVLATAMQSGQRQSEAQLINEAVEGLDENLKSLITPEVRLEIDPSAVTLAQNLRRNGLPVPGIKQLVKRAAQGLLSEQLLENEHKRATDEISAKLDKRASQRTARPVQHRSSEPGLTRKEKQEQNVKKLGAYMSEHGMR